MKTTGKIFSVAVIIATLLCSLLCINAFAEGTEKSARIISNNVYYGEKVALMYAVEAQNLAEGDDVKVVIYDEEGALVGNAEYWKDDTVNGIESKIYISAGVPAQKIDTVFYAKVQIVSGGETVYESSTAQRYSVLEYLHERLFCEEITEDQEALYKGLLTYAELAQKVLIDGIAEEDYISNYAYVAIEGGTLDGTYSAGMYKKGTAITSLAYGAELADGEELSWNVTAYDLSGAATVKAYSASDVEAGSFTVIGNALFISPTILKITTTYTFADYAEGSQYAKDEIHVLDSNVTVTTTQCHFTSELRIYSSSTHNGYAIVKSEKDIASISFNAGENADTLNVYASTDGEEWTLISEVAVTSSYTDYTVDLASNANNYKYLKFDVEGTKQVRLKSLTITTK